MNRSGYSDDYNDDNRAHLYRGRVASALRGRRGQAFLQDLLAQLDAMPEKRLVTSQLEKNGEVCTLGVMTRARGIDTTELQFSDDEYDDDDGWVIANLVDELDIAEPMVREIMFENDEGTYRAETPEDRYARMCKWVKGQIKL